MVKKLDAIKIYEIAESGNTGGWCHFTQATEFTLLVRHGDRVRRRGGGRRRRRVDVGGLVARRAAVVCGGRRGRRRRSCRRRRGVAVRVVLLLAVRGLVQLGGHFILEDPPGNCKKETGTPSQGQHHLGG